MWWLQATFPLNIWAVSAIISIQFIMYTAECHICRKHVFILQTIINNTNVFPLEFWNEMPYCCAEHRAVNANVLKGFCSCNHIHRISWNIFCTDAKSKIILDIITKWYAMLLRLIFFTNYIYDGWMDGWMKEFNITFTQASAS